MFLPSLKHVNFTFIQWKVKTEILKGNAVYTKKKNIYSNGFDDYLSFSCKCLFNLWNSILSCLIVIFPWTLHPRLQQRNSWCLFAALPPIPSSSNLSYFSVKGNPGAPQPESILSFPPLVIISFLSVGKSYRFSYPFRHSHSHSRHPWSGWHHVVSLPLGWPLNSSPCFHDWPLLLRYPLLTLFIAFFPTEW